MDAHGMCRKGGGSGGDEVAHDIGGTMLRMYAKRVTRTDELDDPSLLEVPLPTPFGRYLVHAPVTWSCDGGALTIKKLDELLGSLIQTRRREQSQSVTLQSYRADEEMEEEEEEEPPSASEDDASEDEGEEEEDEEEEEEEGEEEEEEEEEEEDDP